MSRPIRVLLISSASAALAAFVAACGTEKLNVPTSDPTVHHGAVLFSQRCAGCHTLSFAATHGSASNVRSRQITDGPNFNVRCERPATRVLYAIENGGFSGAIMPQNVVVGQDAIAVAKFVATYAGRQSPKLIGVQPCQSQAIGAIPPPSAATAAAATTTTSTTSTTSTTAKAKSTAVKAKSNKKKTKKK